MTQEEVILDLCHRFHASQKPKEIAWFWEACKKLDPKVVVEIGIFAGGTLKILSTLVTDPNGIVVGIDCDWHNWIPNKWDLTESICPLKLLDGDSHNPSTVEKLKEMLGGRLIDVLFIDGDHSEWGCRLDYNMFGPLVRKGGIIGFHDLVDKGRYPSLIETYADERNWGVWGFWDSLKHPEKSEFFAPEESYGIGYIIKG